MQQMRRRALDKPRACENCHARKIRCDLSQQINAPCTRCREADLPCRQLAVRRRPIRAVLNSGPSPLANSIQLPINPFQPEIDSPQDPPESSTRSFASLGPGDDNPRNLQVVEVKDFSKEDSILVEFLSQDFSTCTIGDYQVTFVDDYTCITRILGREYGQGFKPDVYHYRDAPFVRRDFGSIPRSISEVERSMLDRQSAFTIPSQKISDSFVAAFFDRVYPTMPILDRGDFMRHYYLTSSTLSPTTALPIPILLVQSVLLAGSTVYQHPDLEVAPDEVSSQLYARAKALIDNRYEQDRLTLVQSYLLFSIFNADSCDDTIQNMWLSIGTAIRVAQGLGMHRDLGKAKASQKMRRQWKRIWWTLFQHDVMCSFEWGRPRAINLADSDVSDLTEEDFSPDEPGALPSTEHTLFFLRHCELCFIISDWLELLRPKRRWRLSRGGNATEPTAELLACRVDLQQWFDSLVPLLQAPAEYQSISLWAAMLHMTYQAAVLRFYSLTPIDSQRVNDAAAAICLICSDLASRNLLDSVWVFGIHELDLAMGQHARQLNDKDPNIASDGLQKLRQALPLLESQCKRSSVARQGFAFYKMLVENKDVIRESEMKRRPCRDQIDDAEREFGWERELDHFDWFFDGEDIGTTFGEPSF